MHLFTLLIPDNEKTRTCQAWKRELIDKCGGYTIGPTCEGAWKASEGRVIVEPILPVTLLCSEVTIREIALYIKHTYNEESVMFWKLSNEAFLI